MTNHKWNVLNIMRFYTRIGQPFNAKVYLDFVTPGDGPLGRNKTIPTLSEIQLIIRRYIENGWAQRVEDNVVITSKGIKAMQDREYKTSAAYEEKRKIDYIAKGFARPDNRDSSGKYVRGGVSSRKQKKETQK